MNIRVLYFGVIAEITQRNEELIEVVENTSVDQLKKIVYNQYPSLQSTSFSIAINQQIVNQDRVLTSENEVALLPPFSGG